MVRLLTVFVLLAGFAALLGSASSGGAALSYPAQVPAQDVHTTFDARFEAVSVPVTAKLLASCVSPNADEDGYGCPGKVLVTPTPPLLFDVTGFAPRVAPQPKALATAPDGVDLRPPRRSV